MAAEFDIVKMKSIEPNRKTFRSNGYDQLNIQRGFNYLWVLELSKFYEFLLMLTRDI